MSKDGADFVDIPGTGLTLRFGSAADHIAKVIRQTGNFYEHEMLADIRSRLFFAEAAVDVGAHVGNHTLYFAHVLGLRTHSFEAHPDNFAHLARNVTANGLDGLCRVRHAAVGATAGRVRAAMPSPDNSGMASVTPDASGDVEMVTLDVELAEAGRIDLLKIDVEGGELAVLQGADGVLRRDRPLIYVEVMEPEFASVRAHLQQLQYVCWRRFNATPTFLFLPVERLNVSIS